MSFGKLVIFKIFMAVHRVLMVISYDLARPFYLRVVPWKYLQS